MIQPKSKTIPILAGLFFAVVVAAAALLWLLPGQPKMVAPENPLLVLPPATLDVSLFNRSAYQQLNLQVITSGSLPVQPPATVGKANPFL